MDETPINEFLVGVSGGGVVIMNPPRGPISNERAIAFAAWIVALSGATDEEFAEQTKNSRRCWNWFKIHDDQIVNLEVALTKSEMTS